MVATAFTIVSFKRPSAVANSKASSFTLAWLCKMVLATVSSNVKNCSFLATKSVSEFTSTAIALLPSITTLAKPSAAIRPDFF